LSLSGRIPPMNSTISLDASAAPVELTIWPEFHNGVAAGLRVKVPETSSLTRNWILYNRSTIQSLASNTLPNDTSNTAKSREALENGHAG
jgi:anaphase-promoting complex subunit 1